MIPTELPLLTWDIPGCGGVLKAAPEDFQVEEVPAYLPSGEGEHLFLWVEKRDLATLDVVRALSRALDLDEREVGYAGMKDRRAVTRQLFSVPARLAERLSGFSLPGAQVLWAKRHGNKLRTGHLRGNRFRILLREVKDAGAARACVEQLGREGFPNYFGEQRFGQRDDNAELGKQLLLGQRLPKKPNPRMRRLYLSAYQSLLFNRALAQRLSAGTFARALWGDVLQKLDSGGLFVCEAPEVDQLRLARFEVSPAGPIFGPKMVEAKGEVAVAEAKLLEEEGVSASSFAAGRGETLGTRRAYRLPLRGVEVTAEGTGLWLTFELPAGSYATVVLRELTKEGAQAR